MPDADFRVDCIDTAWGFAAIRPEWNALLRATASNVPFLTWEWLYPWFMHLAGTSTLRIVTVRDQHELIGIAPFRIVNGLPWFRQLEFLGTGLAGSDYLDLILRPGREGEALGAIARFLGAEQITLRLDHLPEGSYASGLMEMLTASGWSTAITPDGVCPRIPLAGHTWDSLLGTLGPAHRANVRRRLRSVERQFDTRFELVSDKAARGTALEALARFHQHRFREHGGSTAFLTPEARAFQDEATQRALDRGWLRMYTLHLDDALVAVMYGFLYDRAFYFYQHGFDHRHSHHSIGLVLMALTIRAAIDEDVQAFDLLWGTELYKALWTQKTRTLERIRLFPPHAGGRVHRRAVEARHRLGRLARRVLTHGEQGVPRT